MGLNFNNYVSISTDGCSVMISVAYGTVAEI